jgi:hypothetical protein
VTQEQLERFEGLARHFWHGNHPAFPSEMADDLIKALRELYEASQWQPIETYKSDYGLVVLKFADGSRAPGWRSSDAVTWSVGTGRFTPAPSTPIGWMEFPK